VSTEHSERYAKGWDALTRVNQTSDPRVVRELEQWAPDIARAIVEFGYGETYARSEQLPDRDRQLATVSALTAMGGCEAQLDIHLTAALRMGISAAELTELMLHLTAFCGFPRVINALGVLRTVFDRNKIAMVGS
jgi:4-carboxymuconolactone decarboxylase